MLDLLVAISILQGKNATPLNFSAGIMPKGCSELICNNCKWLNPFLEKFENESLGKLDLELGTLSNL
jgi:hypothetical protein